MRMNKKMIAVLIASLVLAGLLLAACGGAEEEPTVAATAEPASAQGPGPGMGMGQGMGMGPNSGMMARHHATIPEEYAGLKSPIEADEDSLARGAELYANLCATCHGDGGMGDGPGAAGLDPAPAPIAHTSQMMGDDYLFWRITEGGAAAPFSSAMPAWGPSVEEQGRWDLINYIRALGQGTVTPGSMMGGATYDPAAELAQREEMMVQGIDQGVISQEEADVFMEVHAAIDDLIASGDVSVAGNMDASRLTFLAELVSRGTISQAQADSFEDIHARLLEAGLMQ